MSARQTDGADHEAATQGTDRGPGALASSDSCCSHDAGEGAKGSVECGFDVDVQCSRALAARGHLHAQDSPDYGAYKGPFRAPGTWKNGSESLMRIHYAAWRQPPYFWTTDVAGHRLYSFQMEIGVNGDFSGAQQCCRVYKRSGKCSDSREEALLCVCQPTAPLASTRAVKFVLRNDNVAEY